MNGSFFYGVLGMLCTVLLFAGGVVVGWVGHIRYMRHEEAARKIELTEQEKRRQREEAHAFHQLTNYNTDIAYGIAKVSEIYDDTDKG